jgi:hypothetical protein
MVGSLLRKVREQRRLIVRHYLEVDKCIKKTEQERLGPRAHDLPPLWIRELLILSEEQQKVMEIMR